jgi:flavin reductase (DIM6/NTAB) family NADH-FMN oxidoreductase RutF
MEKYIKVSRFYTLLHPRITTLITTYCGNQKYNVMPCTWHTPVTWDPDLILIVVDKENFTHECIRKTGEFVVNIPDDKIINKIMKLAVHGHKRDKFRSANIEVIPSRHVKPPIIKGSIAYMEVKLEREVELDEESLFIGRVLDARIRKDVSNKYGTWDYAKAKLILQHWHNVFIKIDPESMIYAPE